MIDNLRNKISTYLLDVEQLVFTLQECLPLLLERVELLPGNRQHEVRGMLMRLNKLLAKIEKESDG